MIYDGLHATFPTLSRSTIYQSLELFCEKGAAMKILVGDGEMRFDADVARHGHFRCIKCNTVSDFKISENTALPLPEGNYRILNQHLFYQGLCPSCCLPA